MAGDFGTAALVALSEGRKRPVAHSRLLLTLPEQTAHKTHGDEGPPGSASASSGFLPMPL